MEQKNAVLGQTLAHVHYVTSSLE